MISYLCFYVITSQDIPGSPIPFKSGELMELDYVGSTKVHHFPGSCYVFCPSHFCIIKSGIEASGLVVVGNSHQIFC